MSLREIPTREWPIFLAKIDDASGRRLTLRFRIAAAPGALDGLAPGET